MRHRKSKLQLNRFTSWRKATLGGLARNVLIYQSIRTTKTKAFAARPLIEKLISLAKKNNLAAKRLAYKILNDHKLVSLLFGDIGGRFKDRTGGYVRILNLGRRRGDNAEMAILELTEIKKKEIKKHIKVEKKPEGPKEHPGTEVQEEKKAGPKAKVLERPTDTKKPPKKFLGGIRNIFKKERDSL